MPKTKQSPVHVCDCASGDDALKAAFEIIDEMSTIRCMEWLLTVSELIENVIANIVLRKVRQQLGTEWTHDMSQDEMLNRTHQAVYEMLERNTIKAHRILGDHNGELYEFVERLLDREFVDHTDVQFRRMS